MSIERSTTLFFDASVLVAGAHSEEGGSALLLEACAWGQFTAQATSLVILEALHALQRDFPPRSLARFHDDLLRIEWQILAVPAEERLLSYASLVDLKDLHVLASAAEAGSDFLLTLDRQHLLSARDDARDAGLGVEILTPGAFIRTYYHQHEAYAALPPPRDRSGA